MWGKKGDIDRAIEDFGEAIRLSPEYALPFRSRAEAWRLKRENIRALADYNTAIILMPSDAKSREGRCVVYFMESNSTDALEDCSEAIRLDTRSSVAFLTRGLIREAIEDLNLALSDFRSHIDIEPTSLVGANAAARVLAKLKILETKNP